MSGTAKVDLIQLLKVLLHLFKVSQGGLEQVSKDTRSWADFKASFVIFISHFSSKWVLGSVFS